MSIEAFQIASAVFGATTVGFAHLAYGLRQKLKQEETALEQARGHVANLQRTLTEAYDCQDDLERRCTELNKIVTKVHDQRQRALRKAHEKNREASESRAATKAEATVKTLSALQAAPLRPRDEVVASIRSSKAAQAVSSGG